MINTPILKKKIIQEIIDTTEINTPVLNKNFSKNDHPWALGRGEAFGKERQRQLVRGAVSVYSKLSVTIMMMMRIMMVVIVIMILYFKQYPAEFILSFLSQL